jgi:hypothetical protein
VNSFVFALAGGEGGALAFAKSVQQIERFSVQHF